MDNFNKWKESNKISSGNIANLFPKFIAESYNRDIIRQYRIFDSLVQTDIFVSTIKDCGFDLIFCEDKDKELRINLFQVKTVDNLQLALNTIGPGIDDLVRAYTYFSAVPIRKFQPNKVNQNNYSIISDFRKEINHSKDEDFIPKKYYDYPDKKIIFNLHLCIYGINEKVEKKDLYEKFNSRLPDKSLVPTWEFIYDEYKNNNLKLTQQLKNPNLFHKIHQGNMIKVNLNNSQRNLHCGTEVNFILLTDEDFKPSIKKDKISIRLIKGSQFIDRANNSIDVLYGITSLGEILQLRELSNDVFKYNPRSSIVLNTQGLPLGIKNQAEDVQNGIRDTLKDRSKLKSFHKHHSGFLLSSNSIRISNKEENIIELSSPLFLLNGRQSLEVLSNILRIESDAQEQEKLKKETYVSIKVITTSNLDELPMIAKAVNTQIPLTSASLLLWADPFIRKNIEEFNNKSKTTFVKIRLGDQCNDERKLISIFEIINILTSRYYFNSDNLKNKKLKIPISESSDTKNINEIIKEIRYKLYPEGNIIDYLLESMDIYNEVEERLKSYLEETENEIENNKIRKDETHILMGYLYYRIRNKHFDFKKLEEWTTKNLNGFDLIIKFLESVFL